MRIRIRTLLSAAAAIAASAGLAAAAAGPTTLANLWNFGGFHNGIVGLVVQDSSGNIAPGVAPYDKNGNPNDAAHPLYTQPVAAADPCMDPNVAKSSAIINIGAAATTKIVDVSSGKKIYACGWAATLAGTTPTVKFSYGTHASADCDTAAADLSGAMAPTSGTYMHSGPGSTLFSTPASQQLCGVTTGTGSSFQGRLTYVQQP